MKSRADHEKKALYTGMDVLPSGIIKTEYQKIVPALSSALLRKYSGEIL
jgi:hypothetical protein